LYAAAAAAAYNRLAADSGRTLAPRALVFVFPDGDDLSDGVRVLTGSPLRGAGHVAPPGFAWMNSVWIEDDKFPDRYERYEALAHELTHLFVRTAAGGKTVPSWLNEGLAVQYELTLPAEEDPDFAEWSAASYTRWLLDAAGSIGPVPLFHLSEIAAGRDWDRNYDDGPRRRLQYAQGNGAVRWLIEQKDLPTLWSLLRRYGDRSGEFETAFSATYGWTLDEFDARTRADWQREAERTVRPPRLAP
jgi:hypothetical protein